MTRKESIRKKLFCLSFLILMIMVFVLPGYSADHATFGPHKQERHKGRPGFELPSDKDEHVVFGPKKYVRHKKMPVAELATFRRPDIGEKFKLVISNGDRSGKHQVSAGEISLNGKTCVTSSDLQKKAKLIEIEVTLEEMNKISVLLQGAPGSFLTVSIVTSSLSYPTPVVSLAADPASIVAGEFSTLSWSSENAEHVFLEPDIGQVDLNGTMDIAPSQTTTYIITATGPGGTVSEDATVTVVVVEPPPAVLLSAYPENITAGASVTLSWDTANAASCSIDHGIGDVDLSGSLSVSPADTTTYTMLVTGPGGSTSASATVTVATPAPVVVFEADPLTIKIGEASTLSWNVDYADSVTIDQGIGQVAAAGSVVVTPSQATTYTLSASGLGGSTGAQVAINVTADIEPQPEGSFGAQYEDLIPADATLKEYDHKRFALITGKVEGADKAPLQGATISVGATSCIQCHGQKYGTVKTDADGQYTIPVEGGGHQNRCVEKRRIYHLPSAGLRSLERYCYCRNHADASF